MITTDIPMINTRYIRNKTMSREGGGGGGWGGYVQTQQAVNTQVDLTSSKLS